MSGIKTPERNPISVSDESLCILATGKELLTMLHVRGMAFNSSMWDVQLHIMTYSGKTVLGCYTQETLTVDNNLS